jgi:hypothetical protein
MEVGMDIGTVVSWIQAVLWIIFLIAFVGRLWRGEAQMPNFLKSNVTWGIAIALGMIISGASLYMNYTKEEPAPWKTDHLTPFTNVNFHDELVEIDGKVFEDCTFTNVTFFYRGKKPFSCRHNTIKGNQYVRTDSEAAYYWTELLKMLGMMNPNLPYEDVRSRLPKSGEESK